MDLSADAFRRVERPSMNLFRRYWTMESFLVFENVAFCSRLQTGFVALSVRFCVLQILTGVFFVAF